MKISRCESCPWGQRGPAISGRGRADAPLVFFAESPGKQEIRDGEPLVGPSGSVIEAVLPPEYRKVSPEDMHLSHDDILIINSMSCSPHKKTIPILRKGVIACRERILAIVAEHPRKVIFAMGAGALWSLTGNYNLKVTQERGKIIPSELAELGIVTSVHPAYLMRGGGSFRQFKEDIQRGFDLLEDQVPIPYTGVEYTLHDTPAKIEKIIPQLLKQKLLFADTETTGFDFISDKIIALGVSYDKKHCHIFPREVFSNSAMKKLMQGLFHPLLHGAKRRNGGPHSPKWCWHNGKFDVNFLKYKGFQARVDEDTMLLSYARDENKGIHNLEQLGSDVVGLPSYKHVMAQYDNYGDAPPEVLHKYLAQDCSSTKQVFDIIRLQIRKDKALEKLYTQTLIPSSTFYHKMEQNGFLMDMEEMKVQAGRLIGERSMAKEAIWEMAGREFNVNAWQQVADFLYGTMKIRPYKGRRKTAKDLLAKLLEQPTTREHQKDAINLILAYRKAQKMYSTYVQGFERELKVDGRIHATVNIHGTVTGRPSCKEPNMFNIPRDPRIRGLFTAPEGKAVLDFDLDQAELRVLAILSNDEFLRSIYLEGRKLHDEMATRLFGVGYSDEQRMRAKAVNFGIPYGRMASSLAEEFNIPIWEAQEMIDGWFKTAVQAKEFLDKCREAPILGRTLVTPFGRKRRFGLVTKDNLSFIQNEASNFPMQSISSDITLHTGIIVQPKLEKLGIPIVNFVYDSLIMECPIDAGLVAEVKHIIDEALIEVEERWLDTDIKFSMSHKMFTHWGNPETAINLKATQ